MRAQKFAQSGPLSELSTCRIGKGEYRSRVSRIGSEPGMNKTTWKETLGGKIPPAWGEEIDVFETQIHLRKQGRIEEKLFAETRLRRGVYGQRYDNGQRHDGIESRVLAFPSGELTKGPMTFWDAPGMQR